MTDARELLTPELIHDIEEAAHAQSRKPAEVLQEAVAQYLERQSWVAYVEGNEKRARAKGITPEKAAGFVDEVRQENRNTRGH